MYEHSTEKCNFRLSANSFVSVTSSCTFSSRESMIRPCLDTKRHMSRWYRVNLFLLSSTLPLQQLLDIIRKLLETEHERYNFAFSEMPKFYIKDYPPYLQKNKKQANILNDRQMNGDSIRPNSVDSSSISSVAPTSQPNHPQNNVQQPHQQKWNPHQAEAVHNNPLPTYDRSVPPPMLPTRFAYPNGFYQSNLINWNAPPSFQVSPNQMQNGWPQHMQQQPVNFLGPQQNQIPSFVGPQQQNLNFAGPSQQQFNGPQMRNMGGFSVRGRGGQKVTESITK